MITGFCLGGLKTSALNKSLWVYYAALNSLCCAQPLSINYLNSSSISGTPSSCLRQILIRETISVTCRNSEASAVKNGSDSMPPIP